SASASASVAAALFSVAFFAGAFAGAFFAVVFFAVAFLAGAFFAVVFFAGVFAVAFFAVVFFAGAFAVAFFAVVFFAGVFDAGAVVAVSRSLELLVADRLAAGFAAAFLAADALVAAFLPAVDSFAVDFVATALRPAAALRAVAIDPPHCRAVASGPMPPLAGCVAQTVAGGRAERKRRGRAVAVPPRTPRPRRPDRDHPVISCRLPAGHPAAGSP